MNTLAIIESIAATPSKLEKVAIIGKNLDNPVFLRTLDTVFNPFHAPLNIKQTPNAREHTGNMTLDEFFDELPLFQNRTVSGNAARDYLLNIFEELSCSDAEVARRVITKDLRAGFSESSINTARIGTIPIYPCHKAIGLSDNALKNINYPAWGQIKADGMRGNMFFLDGVVTCRSRNGKLMDLFGVFDYLIPMCATRKDSVADGEFVLILPNGKKMDRKKGNGILNKAIRGTISAEEAAIVQFVAWDYVPLVEFQRLAKRVKKGESYVPYGTRFENAADFVDKATMIEPEDAPNTRILLSENVVLQNLDEAKAYYHDAADRGEEGIILKNIDHPFENGKSKHLVKFKAERDCDLEVIGFNYGKPGTKLEGMLGSLICKSCDGGLVTSISGFTDEMRAEIWANIDEWTGKVPGLPPKIVAVKYNERSRGHGAEGTPDALDHGYFIEERLDKDTADHSKDIE